MDLPTLETKRLILRPLTLEDLPALAELYSDPDVMRYLGNGKPRSLEETKASLEKILGQYRKYGFGLYAMIRKENGAFIGRGGLIPWQFSDEEEVEVAYMVAKRCWGQGYATEVAQCFLKFGWDNTDYPYFISVIHPDNVVSIKVAQKIGMTFWKERTIQGIAADIYRVNRFEKI